MNQKNLIIYFGGITLKTCKIYPFKLLNYFSQLQYLNANIYFFNGNIHRWYHTGFNNITNNIDESISYLNNIINKRQYNKVIFIGISVGGYASLLFGSLCKVDNVISYVPNTKFQEGMIDNKYFDLKNIINDSTNYILRGDLSIKDPNDSHHISQCINLEKGKNVKIIYHDKINIKQFIYNGIIEQDLENILK